VKWYLYTLHFVVYNCMNNIEVQIWLPLPLPLRDHQPIRCVWYIRLTNQIRTKPVRGIVVAVVEVKSEPLYYCWPHNSAAFSLLRNWKCSQKYESYTTIAECTRTFIQLKSCFMVLIDFWMSSSTRRYSSSFFFFTFLIWFYYCTNASIVINVKILIYLL
jgi:hypothetical protein